MSEQAHNCDALVIHCKDFRLQKYFDDFIAEQKITFDRVSLAGAGKNVEVILREIETSIRLHSIKKVIVVQHENCGSYGGRDIDVQSADVKLLRQKVRAYFPYLQIEFYYCHLDGKFDKIG